jgi:hypothetical protein
LFFVPSDTAFSALMKESSSLYKVSDQKPLTGGCSPGAKVIA